MDVRNNTEAQTVKLTSQNQIDAGLAVRHHPDRNHRKPQKLDL